MPSGVTVQSVLDPAGTQAAAIHGLWLLMLWTSAAVFVVVLAATFIAFARGTRRRDAGLPTPPTEPSLTRAVSAAAGATVCILFGLLAASVWTGRLVAARHNANAVTINVTGHQWWWEIEYDDPVARHHARLANEIHIPTNRPVVLMVTSRDVIHSLWMPNFQGKRDLIPGYTTAIAIDAARPGVFRAQCAEFCGMQHAHMAMTVVAEADEQFEAWLNAQRTDAREPQSDAERRGRDLFVGSRCSGCHTVRGTPARGQVAPDLTHLASRSSVAAGTLPNTPEHLAAWIADPQAIKPGNQMPANPMSDADRGALVAYLRSLR